MTEEEHTYDDPTMQEGWEDDWDVQQGKFLGLRSVLSELTGKEGENEVRKVEKTSDLRFEQIISDLNGAEWIIEGPDDKDTSDFWEDYWGTAPTDAKDWEQERDETRRALHGDDDMINKLLAENQTMLAENIALRGILTNLLNRLDKMIDEYTP